MGHYLRGLNILCDDNQFGDSSLDRLGRFVCTLSEFSGVFRDLQKLIGLVNGLFWNLESYVNGFLCHPDSLSSARCWETPGSYERFDSEGNNTKYGASRSPRRHVTSTAEATSTGKATSTVTGTGKAEEEAANEERTLRDFRLNDKAAE